MLASILPGLRDVRTPLATGYLYAFALWMIFGNNLLPSRMDNEFAGRIQDLSELLGNGATIAALSFVSYLVGSILTIRQLPPRIVNDLWIKGAPHREIDDGYLGAWVEEQCDRLAARGWSVQTLFNHQDVPQSFRGRLREAAIAHGVEEEPEVIADRTKSRPLFKEALRVEVETSHDVLVTLLQIERENLFAEYDRIRSEAELRFSLTVPLIVVAVVGSVIWTSWALLLVALPVVLLMQGVGMSIRASDRVYQALARGVVQLPILRLLLDQLNPGAGH